MGAYVTCDAFCVVVVDGGCGLLGGEALGGGSSRSEGSHPSLCLGLSVCLGVSDQVVFQRPALSDSHVLIWVRSMNERWGGAKYNFEGLSASSVG